MEAERLKGVGYSSVVDDDEDQVREMFKSGVNALAKGFRWPRSFDSLSDPSFGLLIAKPKERSLMSPSSVTHRFKPTALRKLDRYKERHKDWQMDRHVDSSKHSLEPDAHGMRRGKGCGLPSEKSQQHQIEDFYVNPQ